MVETTSVRQEKLLLVDASPDALLAHLKEWLSDFDIFIYVVNTAIEAIVQYKELSPGLMLVNSELPDMSGMSLSTILKDEENGSSTSIFVYNIQHIMQNTKADFFFLKTDEAHFYDVMGAQVVSFYQLRFMQSLHSTELLRAKAQQYEFLPGAIETDAYQVMGLFSAYGDLSGDSYTYWVNDKTGDLYGILFDCTGHDFVSYTYVTAGRIMLKKDMKLYELGAIESLSEVLKSINDDLYAVDAMPESTAAIIFKLDVAEQKFHYCTAGVPGIFVRERESGKWRTIDSENYLLGWDENIDFNEQCVDLKDVQDVIACSDGFYEVTFHEEEVKESQIAKHDDVSAVFIHMKQTSAEA